ncbi:dihydrodipicolinate synthase family protein [Microbacterium sp. Se63.02b]|uniref:dihydrodipicolinate synthase family protein n=1 Tax=Microbacterium sp. Se63.02b TaxID=2709304 RepID=UPI001FCE4C94|nr:dihydrodipicolinate synthase family protein [Microbacterium sp. Se63.02b]
MAPTLHGLMPILATPFDESGRLDRESLRRLVEFQLASGVDGVAVFGMASEGFALTTEERRVILDDVVGVVDGRVPVIAGVNGTSTATSIEQSLLAEEGGADALMVLPPFMVKPPAGTLVDFYGEVAAATSLSVMVQDAPGVTGVAMAPASSPSSPASTASTRSRSRRPRLRPRSAPWSRRSTIRTSRSSADRTPSSASRSTRGEPSARCRRASSRSARAGARAVPGRAGRRGQGGVPSYAPSRADRSAGRHRMGGAQGGPRRARRHRPRDRPIPPPRVSTPAAEHPSSS